MVSSTHDYDFNVLKQRAKTNDYMKKNYKILVDAVNELDNFILKEKAAEYRREGYDISTKIKRIEAFCKRTLG
jgi:hypothetical protein